MRSHPSKLPERRVGIVHDLKGPLATISLDAHLIDEKLADRNHAEIRVALARIGRNVAFLDRMVHDLLDTASVGAGRFEIHRAPTELRALLLQVLDRVVSTRDRARVFLEAPCALMLSVDAERIERVVANLVQNALKYAPRGSAITIRLEGFARRISVTDAGPAMTASEATYIFDRYRRTPSARTLGGSGLGLYISKQIIEAHGGTIGVDSVHGVGSRFFFELPMT